MFTVKFIRAINMYELENTQGFLYAMMLEKPPSSFDLCGHMKASL